MMVRDRCGWWERASPSLSLSTSRFRALATWAPTLQWASVMHVSEIRVLSFSSNSRPPPRRRQRRRRCPQQRRERRQDAKLFWPEELIASLNLPRLPEGKMPQRTCMTVRPTRLKEFSSFFTEYPASRSSTCCATEQTRFERICGRRDETANSSNPVTDCQRLALPVSIRGSGSLSTRSFCLVRGAAATAFERVDGWCWSWPFAIPGPITPTSFRRCKQCQQRERTIAG